MILCIGDSHTQLFRGCNGVNAKEYKVPGVTVEAIGAHLAYNLCEADHAMREAILNGSRGKESLPAVFVLGEIDCRMHLPEYARQSNVTDAVSKCVDRYVKGLHAMEKIFSKVAAFSPHILPKKEVGKTWAAVGTWEEMYAITLEFDRLLSERFEKTASVNLQLIHHSAYERKAEFYLDDTHLNIKCLDWAMDEVNHVLGL